MSNDLEILRTLRQLRKEITELREMVAPIAPKKDEMLDAKGAADLLKYTPRQIYKMKAEGVIPYTMIGRNVRFSRNSLLVWLNQQS